MLNQLLDKRPDTYEGYLIRTDFRIGMQITTLLKDEDFEEYEKLAAAIGLIFGKGAPNDYNVCVEALTWFMNCGKVKEEKSQYEETSQEESFDFEIDNELVLSAFRKCYGVDLNKEKMHWFEFNALVKDLGECALTQIIKVREKKLTENMSREEKEHYQKLKATYSLPKKIQKLTTEEQKREEEFYRLLKEGEENGAI